MKILALDTSTEACSAALWVDGHTMERYEWAQQKHSQFILPMLDSLLAEAEISLNQIDALAFGRGPGSFTGVRMGASIIQALAFAHDLPVVPISTLAALAYPVLHSAILACIDARMGEVYCAAFNRSDTYLTYLMPETLCRPEGITLPEVHDSWYGVGSGCSRYSMDKVQVIPDSYPHARDIALLAIEAYQRGEIISAENALPIYLRDQVTWQTSKH